MNNKLSDLVGIGPKVESYLNELGINTPDDLVHFYPYRHLDFSSTLSIAQFDTTAPATYGGRLIKFQNIYTRSYKNIQKATIQDSTGQLDLIWFNSSYLSNQLTLKAPLNVAGLVSFYQGRPTIIAPLIGTKTGRIIPIYHQTAHLKSSQIEKIIHQNFEKLISNISDPLPPAVIQKYQLSSLAQALREIHHPTNGQQLQLAKRRLGLDPILSLLATSHLQKQALSARRVTHQLTITPAADFVPYSLSPSQLTTWKQVQSDILSAVPCHRLICGDVGSGKTIIALMAAHLTHANNQQSLIIAPTQVLAQQHYEFFKQTLPNHPIFFLKPHLVKFPKNAIIISTHAAFYRDTKLLTQVALLIIDEQHKFGVEQRNFLSQLPHPPHSLSLSATPIPRTLALSVYGHLDVSYLNHLPHWQPVKTYVVPPNKVTDCYQWLDQHLQNTHQQAFVVCPFIEESTTSSEVKAATTQFKELTALFPKLKLALIHSKIKPKDRQIIFDKFKSNKINILVTTPIIEVGIDYPNATVIIIQSADRFGLATLHQLRGRVGRGGQPGYCYLFTNQANPRLRYLSSHFEGQELAEYDLRVRGQGQLFSTIQHGHFPLDLSLISLGQQIINDLLGAHLMLQKLSNLDNSTISID